MGESPTTFADTLNSQLELEHISIQELAKRCHTTYEFMRRIAKGQAYPSQKVLDCICRVTKLDSHSAAAILAQERSEKKFGVIPSAIKEDGRLMRIRSLWRYLTEDQRETVVGIIQGIARKNRENKQ